MNACDQHNFHKNISLGLTYENEARLYFVGGSIRREEDGSRLLLLKIMMINMKH